MKLLFITLALSGFMLFGCGNNADQKSNEHSETVHQDDHHHDDDNETIELNNGEKWKVDNNMMVHIRTMEQDFSAYETAQNKDFKELAYSLQANIDLLTSNCTMKGKAHDELHKWLLPYIETVEELSASKSDKDAAEYLSEIKLSFQTFNQYFQ